MAVTCDNTTIRRDKDNRSHENEVFLEAIKNCDDKTYKEITSILTAKGLLHG